MLAGARRTCASISNGPANLRRHARACTRAQPRLASLRRGARAPSAAQSQLEPATATQRTSDRGATSPIAPGARSAHWHRLFSPARVGNQRPRRKRAPESARRKHSVANAQRLLFFIYISHVIMNFFCDGS